MNTAGTHLPWLAADLSILLPGVYLAGALLVGAVIVGVVSRWRRLTRGPTCSPSDQLAHFRSLYERGAISEEEFNRLRAVLGGELRRTLNVPANQPDNPPAGAVTPGPDAAKPGPDDPGIHPA
jgi:hypothetical protein